MDETIIEYIYWNNNSYRWDVVLSKNYDNFFSTNEFISNYSDGVTIFKPLKLEYKILYDVSGNPYNNLKIINDSSANDLNKAIYIFKPNDEFSDRNFFVNDLSYNDKGDISFNNFSNMSDITFTIEDKFKKNSIDISENIFYNKKENSNNFILRPGKWFFLYDPSGNSEDLTIPIKFRPWVFISTIKIPHIDFLYDNKKVNMVLNNTTFDKIFLTINNLDLVEMRGYFSKYYSTLGKNDIASNDIDNDYMRIFFEFLLWTPNNINNNNTFNNNAWFLPDNYTGPNDERIQEAPTYYLENYDDDEETLYEDYYNNEPGLRYDRVSYKNRIFYANHIARINSNKFTYSYGSRTFTDSTYPSNLSRIIGLSPTNTITKYTYTPNAWTGDIEINASIYRTLSNNNPGIVITQDSTLPTITSEGINSPMLREISYRISWYTNLDIFEPNNNTARQSFGLTNFDYTYNLKITIPYKKNNGKIKVFLDGVERLECNAPDWDQFYIWIGGGTTSSQATRKVLFNSISISHNSSANNVKDISDCIFQINDLNKNFMNADCVTQDISFVNITQVVDEASGTLKLIDDGTPIDNWEAVLICPAGLVLQDGGRNILSSYADSSNNSGFSLGIVGNGLYNADNPNESYIFKDICGNIFPNVNNIIDLTSFGVEFDISNNESFVKKPFNIRYRIRKNTEKTDPPNHDVYIFINDNFVTKIADNGCKLNDIKYWGTPYDPVNPYKEYDISNNGFILPKINGIPRGHTTILQSLKVNYIEDIYRPFGKPDSSFINTILYNDNQYLEISGNLLTEYFVDLSYNSHEHKQTTVTTNPNGFVDISVNPINNYPCTISYDIKKDKNITPLYNNYSDMINLDNLSSDEFVRTLRDSNNNNYWGATSEQVKPLNYSYIFDAGEDRTIVLTVLDFQFLHGASEVFDRLEIVGGDISDNTIIWEKIKNNNQSITWMHNLQDTATWKDSTPLSDENLKKNTEIDNTLQARAAIKKPYFLSYSPNRYENNYKLYDPKQYLWQPPPTNHPYYITNESRWKTYGDLFSAEYISSRWWIKSNRPYYYWYYHYLYGGYFHFWYSSYYPWAYGSNSWASIYFKKPLYYPDNIKDKIENDIPLLYGYYIPRKNSGYDIKPSVVGTDEGTGKQYTNGQYSLSITFGYRNRWYYEPYYIYYYNKESKEIKKNIQLITKTYGTHNYNPKFEQLKEINESGDEVTVSQGDQFGLEVPLGIRDFRSNTDISMKFDRDGSPYSNGLDGTDEYGQPSTSGEDPAIKLSSLDINGSILPKNKQRAIKILDFYNTEIGTGIISNEKDVKIWKIYTNKRFVRLNYFALKSSTNSHFEIKVDRTLSATEINTLKEKWDSEQKIVYKQKDRGILPVILSDANNNDLANNQIESIVNEINPSHINLSEFPNSNYFINNNNEVPYISLYNYDIRDQTNDIILSSRIKKTLLDETHSYKYDDNRNLRELNINSNPKTDSSNNKIKQKYNYNVKLFNKPRSQTLPYIPQQISTTFIRSSSNLQFLFLNIEKLRLKNNLINYWLGDIHKTYIKLYLFIWKPYSEYLGINGGKKNINNEFNNANIDNELLKNKLNVDMEYLSIQDYSNNFILYNNSSTISDVNPVENHINQFDQLLEISFDINSFFYGINSVGFPEKKFEYQITQFKGQYLFYWTYHVFQPDGIYNNISPYEKLIINNTQNLYEVDAQMFDTSKFTKDDFIYDPNSPKLEWIDTFENTFKISLENEEKIGFKSYLNLLQKDFSSMSANLDISCVEIIFYLWTPNNSKYDKIFGEDLSSNNTTGWILPDDYYGVQDSRILFTPYKTNTLSWNPTFFSYTYDSSGTTHYGYNFDLSGVIKRKFTFKKKGDRFDIDNSISDISFNDLSFNITKNDISFNSNDTLYNIDDKLPNTLEYLKLDNTTNVEYSVPYISRWSHIIYDTSNQKIESRVIKLSGSFGNETSFNIKFSLDSNYYYELNRTGTEGATPFRRLLQQKKTDGITFGYKKNTSYLLIKVDDITYQLYMEEPPFNYAFFQLDEDGNDIVDSNGEPIKIVDNTIKNINRFNTGVNIDGNDIYLNSSSPETKYILYVRPSTDKEKKFFNSLNKHQIVQMESEEIRNRFSNWEPMRHNNNISEKDSNNYYRSDNQYKYGVLFSTFINKEVKVVEEEEIKIDPCNLCRPINHASKDFISSKLKYANRERLSRTQAAKYTTIC